MLGALDVPVLLACTVRIKSTGEATNVAIHAPKIATVLRKGNSDGLFFPLDFTSREDATVGGFLSTNAGGLSVLKYGSARSMCLGVEVVLPNGDIWNGLGGLRKDNAGYDIKDLFIGSEGTLGFITSAVVSLVSNPTQKYTSLLISKDLNSTLNFFCDVQLKSNNQLTAFEIMTDGSIELLMNYFPELIPNNFKKYKNSIFILVEIRCLKTSIRVF